MGRKKSLLLMVLSVALTGAIGCGVASNHTDTTEPGPDVRTVSDDALIKRCQKIGPVSATSDLGGLALQGAGRADVRRKMINNTEKVGGNVLRVNNINSGFFGAKGDGIAYKCQPEWYSKIPND